MLSGGRSYHLFFWVEFAAGAALFLGTFFLFEETMYFRQADPPQSLSTGVDETGIKADEAQLEYKEGFGGRTSEILTPPRKSWVRQLKVIDKDRIDHGFSPVMMVVRASTYYLVPPVFWVCSTYGVFLLQLCKIHELTCLSRNDHRSCGPSFHVNVPGYHFVATI